MFSLAIRAFEALIGQANKRNAAKLVVSVRMENVNLIGG